MSEKKQKHSRATNAWQEARVIVWGYRKRLALGMVLMVVNRGAGFVLPGSSKFLVDNILIPSGLPPETKTHYLYLLGAAVLAATFVQAITSFALSQVLGVAAQRAITEMRKSVQQHILRLPTSFFDSKKTGELVSRIMTDAEGIRNLVGTGLVQLTGGLLTAVVALGVLFYLNWQMTSATIVVLSVFGGCMAYAFNKLRPLFRERGEINAQVTGRLTESLGGIRVVKGYTSERREDIVFAKGVHKLFRNVAAAVTGVSAIGAVTTALIGLIGVLMITMGGRAVIAATMSEGDFFMYIFFVGMVVLPLVQIASIGTQISEAFAGLDRIREIRTQATEDVTDRDRRALDHVEGHIQFENVCFEYDEGLPVLKDVSFDAKAGMTTALVGSSGSGKSTLLGLVMAYHRPSKGAIFVDGQDLNELKLRPYRSHLGLVLQDNFLFDGTIAENIAFSKPNASLEEIKKVSVIAHCDEFVSRFEHGYETVVGERGVKLSGGQRQRIAIARAILSDAQILILDEATSSLDSESEALIQDGLNRLRAGRTTFVIAHRLSTVRSADQILVLEGGKIVESGTHDELLVLNGRYRELYDKQYKLESNRFINPGEEFPPEVA
ncbi:MAG: ABC transporter ATP-binding protein [Candidatus Hydrogenedentes bacterium]|nr:ABC transporter ATP-binding protein [Candidatus Hydrogenedentota bacterium]